MVINLQATSNKLTRHKEKQLSLTSSLSLKRRLLLCLQLLLASCFRLLPCLLWSPLANPDVDNHSCQSFLLHYWQSQRLQLPLCTLMQLKILLEFYWLFFLLLESSCLRCCSPRRATQPFGLFERTQFKFLSWFSELLLRDRPGKAVTTPSLCFFLVSLEDVKAG